MVRRYIRAPAKAIAAAKRRTRVVPRKRRPMKKPRMPSKPYKKRYRRKRPIPRPKKPDYNAMWERKKDVFALNRAKVNYERRLAHWKRYRPRLIRRRRR